MLRFDDILRLTKERMGLHEILEEYRKDLRYKSLIAIVSHDTVF